jgi:hypothetical protein
MGWGMRGKGKYGNKKVEGVPGIWFDSKAEAALYHRLALQQRCGEIHALKCQPGTIFLGPARTQYRPDFSFIKKDGEEVEWAEFKGFETPAWRIKLKLWRSVGPGKLHVYKGSASSMKLVETVIPKLGACPHCGK